MTCVYKGLIIISNWSVKMNFNELTTANDQVLSSDQIQIIVKKWFKKNGVKEITSWKLLKYEENIASNGIAGFLGDHYKIKLTVQIEEDFTEIRIFAKTLPRYNKPKADFIDEGNFNRREKIMYMTIDEMNELKGLLPRSSVVPSYICDDTVLIMPDLSAEGYKTVPPLIHFDIDHLFISIEAVAKLHAFTKRFEILKSSETGKLFNLNIIYSTELTEYSFKDSPWLRASAKLVTNFVKEFSTNEKTAIANLESKVVKSFLNTCESLREHENTLNVLLHKDLWSNNILFKYSNSKPEHAVLVDFQCLRYGPPAFDVMMLLYLTTGREIRDKYEQALLKKYFSIFQESVDKQTKKILQDMNYTFEEFVKWCQISRAFGILEAAVIGPYIFMDPITAKKVFDNPETFEEYMNIDRSAPVINYAYKNDSYRERFLEICEEFIERYV